LSTFTVSVTLVNILKLENSNVMSMYCHSVSKEPPYPSKAFQFFRVSRAKLAICKYSSAILRCVFVMHFPILGRLLNWHWVGKNIH
jgi:hypothetical protein